MSAPIFDKLEVFSFAGHRFPCKSYRIRGGVRDHVHEYPHSPGGAAEKLGRKLYEIQVQGLFLEEQALTAAQRARYKAQLFPAQINGLRALYEEQITDDLVIPHLGKVKAYCISWEEAYDAKNRSGVEVDMTFREDQEGAFIFEVLQIGATTFPQRVDNFASVRAQVFAGRPQPGLFEQINAVANSILAIKDQADLYDSLIASKIASLDNLLNRADAEVDELNDPDTIHLLESFLALWDSTRKLQEDQFSKSVELREYIVPITMSVTQVSTAVYGSTDKAMDLMKLNALENPLAIPANTHVHYYPIAA